MKKYLMLVLNALMIGNICFDFYSSKMSSIPYLFIFFIIVIILYCLFLNSKLSYVNALVSIIGYTAFYIASIFTLNRFLIIIPVATTLASSILFVINIKVNKVYNKLENIAKLLNIPILSYIIYSLMLSLIIKTGIDNNYLFILMIIPMYCAFRVIKRYLSTNNSIRQKCFDFSFMFISSALLVVLLFLLKDYDRYLLITIIDYIILIPIVARTYKNTVADINVSIMPQFSEDLEEHDLLEDDSIIDAEFEEKD